MKKQLYFNIIYVTYNAKEGSAADIMKIKQNKIGFFGGLDFVTLITALISSAYGLALVYSATYSSLTDGQVISGGVRSMLVSVFGGIVLALVLCNIDYEIISKLWPIIAWLYTPNARYAGIRSGCQS